MAEIGEYNGLTDIDGILVGHYTDFDAVSGITVVLSPKGAMAGVDVRGSAPGTRETDLMAPHNLVEQVQAVVLSGGSVFGLSAADGATRWLAEEGYGFPLDRGYVAPIVPAAVLYDLGRGNEFIPPISSDWGRWACEGAGSYPVKSGCIGAGTGALSGGIKGGLGTASIVLDSGITVAALIAVNSDGSVINPESGRPWEIGLELHDEFGEQGKRAVRLPPEPEPEPKKLPKWLMMEWLGRFGPPTPCLTAIRFFAWQRVKRNCLKPPVFLLPPKPSRSTNWGTLLRIAYQERSFELFYPPGVWPA